MNRVFTVLFLLLLIIYPAMAIAGAPADTVIMKAGENQALVDGAPLELETAPRIVGDTTLVPLRFLVEAFGAQVEWNALDKLITVKTDGGDVILTPGQEEVSINGETRLIKGAPLVDNGVTLVPLRFLVESLNYKVDFMPLTKEIYIKQLPPPNRPPVAYFSISGETVDQGETVTYVENSYDPDGDQIIEKKWTGAERAFFQAGEHKVTLTVKDSQGNWSEPCTKTIRVTEKVKMDKLTYNLHNPIPGEPITGLTGISVLDIKTIDPVVTVNRDKIMISNSPEVVQGEGVLYSDVLEGENRLYYHHINGTQETLRIYLMAVNEGSSPVMLTLKKWGAAGPSDPLSVGRAATFRYLDFDSVNARSMELRPGEKVILNQDINNYFTPGAATHGIFDIDADGELTFKVVVVKDPASLDNYADLPAIAGDGKHIRGTFYRGNRSVLVRPDGKEPARLVVADGKDDTFLSGKDGNNAGMGKNAGNYGLIYKINIGAKERMGVLLSPRGGVFAGAGAWDGEAFYLPNRGILKPQTDFAMLGVLEAGERKTLEFIPPAGSYLPVNLIFIPF